METRMCHIALLLHLQDDVQILSTSLDNSLQGRSQIPGEVSKALA